LTAHVSRRLAAWLTVLGALVVSGLVFLLAVPESAQQSASGLPDSYQSVQAERRESTLPSADVQPALVVASRAGGGALTATEVEALTALGREVAALAAGGRVPPPQVSPDGTVATFPVPLDAPAADTERTAAAVDELRTRLREGAPPGVTVEVTGAPAFAADLARVFDGADVTLLIVTVFVVAVLLLLTYRSPVLWIVPLVVVAVGEQVTLRLVALLLPRWDLPSDGAITGITSVLVFGAATNYSLLLISRYREELRRRADRFEAMRIAVRQSGEAILASGGTVVLATLTLLLATLTFNRALGLASAIGIAVAMLTGLLVLPAVLVLCGRWVFWPFVPRVGSRGKEGKVWGRLGQAVARRPVAVAAGGMALLAALAIGGLGLRTGLSQTEQFRAEPEAVRALETLSTAFPAGASTPVAVLTTPQAAAEVVRVAGAVDGVASAEVGESVGDIARVTVVLAADPGSDASFEAVRDLREAVAAADRAAVVGGTVATQLDREDAESRDRQVIIPIVLALVLAVLVVLLRALLAPVLLVLTVVASFFASVGVSWVLFDTVLGFPALDPSVLLLSFLFLVALGVDYNIFLVTRAREEARVAGTRDGMLTALRVTGGVITSAGVLLAAVFAVLGVLPLITLTQIGIIVCVGVLLDTLLVRTVIVPALAFILGARFWWPRRESQLAPHPTVDASGPGRSCAAEPVRARPRS
jgi:RND superfamily putative drug exporter